jgi:HSP20 family protein
MLRFPLDVFFGAIDRREKDANKGARIRPVAGVKEKDDAFVAEFLMPGLDEGSLKVKVVDEELCIEGERTNTIHQQWHGKVTEKISLTPEIDTESIAANYRNGILTVTMPKVNKKQRVKEISIC